MLNLSESAAGRSEGSGTWTEFEPPPDAESNQEDFLALHGECIAIVEEQERPLRQRDFVHCPAGTRHVFVGAGEGPCAILMIGARNPDDRIEYPVSEVAARHNASAAETTNSGREAYREFPPETHDERFEWPLSQGR